MLKNYLLIATRNLNKNKGYSLINIVGLSLGIAACMLLAIHIQYGLRFDRHHRNAEQIYRVTSEVAVSDKTIASSWTPLPLAHVLMKEYPEVKSAGRMFKRSQENIRYGDRNLEEKLFFAADQEIFDIFTFEVLRGNREALLSDPNTAVVTRSFAEKVFGEDAEPVGQLLLIGQTQIPVEVTGVMADLPRTSHFQFNLLVSYNTFVANNTDWERNRTTTYVLLNDGHSGTELERHFPALIEKYLGGVLERTGGQVAYFAQPLLAIHLRSHFSTEFEQNGNIVHLYIMSVVALFILLIAGINFMNLTTARAGKRGREVGVRKALGAQRLQLVVQFLLESVILALLAFGLALALVFAALPHLNMVLEADVSFNLIDDAFLFFVFWGLALGMGLLAGVYPAFYLSAFYPVQVLKGKVRQKGSAVFVRKGLVVFQFAASIVLMISTIIVLRQLDYVQNKDLGFAKDQQLIVPFRTLDVRDNYEALKTALRQDPRVEAVSGTNNPTAARRDNNNSVTVWSEETEDRERIPMTRGTVDFGYIETMGFEIAAGRALSEAFPSDLEEAVVVNETAARLLGYRDDAVGRTLQIEFGGTVQKRTIVGVVRDFHQRSLHEEIGPVLFEPTETIYLLLVRLPAQRIGEGLAFVEETFKTLNPSQDFAYYFISDTFAAYYQAEQRLSKTINTFTLFAILIACLGLFGLAAFTAEERTKEIGIRKVLGATVSSILLLLSKDFLRLVVVAFLVAAPVAFLVMKRWLQDFAYHIDVSLDVFILVGGMVLLVAFMTVSYQALKAALTDPVKTLRYE